MGQGAALVLTLVVECLVVVVLLRPSVIGMSRILAAAAAASLLTHPFAWRAAAALSPDGYAQGVAIIEVAVVLVEAAVLRLLLPVDARRAFVIATIANLASFTAGLALMAPVPLYIVALLWLSLLHNFTPLLLAWDLAREDATQRAVAWGVTALMALPVLVVVGAIGSPGLAAWIATAQGGASGTAPLASQLPFGATPALLPALLTALVLAQCAHYLSVIHLLPQAEARRSGRPPLPQRARSLALLASAVMAAFFLVDHAAAREWYAVAAGAHAWLEWPVLLMAWLGGGALLAQAGEGLERRHA